jgi:hypothetical protein
MPPEKSNKVVRKSLKPKQNNVFLLVWGTDYRKIEVVKNVLQTDAGTMFMLRKIPILFFLAAVGWSSSWAYAQSDRIHNTSVRGYSIFRNTHREAYSPAARFGKYAAGITYSAPPRTSSRPLSGRNGIQAPGSSPSRDFRISSGPLNYQAISTQLTGGSSLRSGLLNSPSRYGNQQRLALPRRSPPRQRARSNPSPFASLSSHAYVPPKGLSFQNNFGNGSSLGPETKGLSSQDSLSQSKSMSQSKGLSEPQFRPALSAPIYRR